MRVAGQRHGPSILELSIGPYSNRVGWLSRGGQDAESLLTQVSSRDRLNFKLART